MNRDQIMRRGREGEDAVAGYLVSRSFVHAERRRQRGARDEGDIAGIPGTVHEVKVCKELELAKWIDEAAAERANAGADIAAVWHKRRGHPSPAEWYVTMTGAEFADLLLLAGYGPGVAAVVGARG